MEVKSDTYENNGHISSDDLIVNLGAYEGPLDILLVMAKSQKVDLMQISILQLTEQYLEFIAKIKHFFNGLLLYCNNCLES